MTLNDLIKKLTDEFSAHTGLDGEDEATPKAITQLHAHLTFFLCDAIGQKAVVALLAGASQIVAAKPIATKEQIH